MRQGTSNDSTRVLLVLDPMPGPAIPAVGDWHGRGLCIGEDPDVFFPSHGDPGMKAREICRACLVRGDCLRCATDADESGIWGGLDQQERRNLERKRRRRAAASSPPSDGLDDAEGAA
jgi:WhiB family transcriptional regulator, redox-sensing transcriptional regulator